MIEVITTLLKIAAETLAGRKSDAEVARELLDAAFATGVPSALLANHLTSKAAADAEFAADLAQALKMARKP